MSFERPNVSASSAPEDFQTDEAVWNLLLERQAELEELRKLYTTSKENNDRLRLTIEQDRAAVDAAEERLLKQYANDPEALALVQERIGAARVASAEVEASCERVDTELSGLIEAMTELEEAVAELHAELRKARN